jgi:hypothetical protein
MLKAIHAQEDRQAAEEKIAAVTKKLKSMKLTNAARIRHVSTTKWGSRQYLNIDRLTENIVEMA